MIFVLLAHSFPMLLAGSSIEGYECSNFVLIIKNDIINFILDYISVIEH